MNLNLKSTFFIFTMRDQDFLKENENSFFFASENLFPRKSVEKKLPLDAASWIAVPFILSWRFTLAPFEMSISTIFLLPLDAAHCSGTLPTKFLRFTSAPCSINSLTMFAWPLNQEIVQFSHVCKNCIFHSITDASRYLCTMHCTHQTIYETQQITHFRRRMNRC